MRLKGLALAAALGAASVAGAQADPVRSFGAGGVSSIASHTAAGVPLSLWSVSITPGTTGGYLMVFDQAGVPEGPVAFPLLRYCAQVQANTSYGLSWAPAPDVFSNQVMVAFSSTGCSTFTPATALWLGAQVQ